MFVFTAFVCLSRRKTLVLHLFNPSLIEVMGMTPPEKSEHLTMIMMILKYLSV